MRPAVGNECFEQALRRLFVQPEGRFPPALHVRFVQDDDSPADDKPS